jgi:hypothetical protein
LLRRLGYAQLLAEYAASRHHPSRKAVRRPSSCSSRPTTRGAALSLGLLAPGAAVAEGAAHLPAHEVARLVQRFDDQLASTRLAAEQAGLLPGAVAPA